MMTGASSIPTLPNSVSCTVPVVSIPSSPPLPSEACYVEPGHDISTGSLLCTGCSQPILDQFILQVQGHMWHAGCLSCSMCHAPLSHVCYSGHSKLYCQDDFFRIFGAQCSSCKGNIPPTGLVRRAQNNIYHLDCFTCVTCERELCTGDEFYLCEDGHLMCKADYQEAKNKEQSENSSNSDREYGEGKENQLQHYYNQNDRPRRDAIEQIAMEAGIEPSQVRSWFRQQRVLKRRQKVVNYQLAEENLIDVIGRVLAPPGGYPLPIVNKAIPQEILPQAASQHFLSPSVNPAPQVENHAHVTQVGDCWSRDFVPPNVNLTPENFSNGEVVGFQLHNSVPIISTADLDTIFNLQNL